MILPILNQILYTRILITLHTRLICTCIRKTFFQSVNCRSSWLQMPQMPQMMMFLERKIDTVAKLRMDSAIRLGGLTGEQPVFHNW
jgi:hypothetical protein